VIVGDLGQDSALHLLEVAVVEVGGDGREHCLERPQAEPALAPLERLHLQGDVPLRVAEQRAHARDAFAHGRRSLSLEVGGGIDGLGPASR